MARIYKTTEAQRERVAKYLNSAKGKTTRSKYVLSGRAAANCRKYNNKPENKERKKKERAEWYRNHKKLKLSQYQDVASL